MVEAGRRLGSATRRAGTLSLRTRRPARVSARYRKDGMWSPLARVPKSVQP